MPGKSLSIVKRTQIITLYKEGKSMTAIGKELGVSKNTVSIWCHRGEQEDVETAVLRKKGSGRPRKTSPKADKYLKRLVMTQPSITSKELKLENPQVLGGLSERTIQRRLKDDLGLPAYRAAKKPLLTPAMKRKRLNFCKTYGGFSEEDWSKVVFSDESCFYVTRSAGKRVRRPRGSNRYESKYTVKTVKHPAYVMVWGCFSGAGGRGNFIFCLNLKL